MVFGVISLARIESSQVLVTKNHCALPQIVRRKPLHTGDQMTEPKAFNKNIDDLVESIDLCFRSQFFLSGLALLYSTLDIMAWLSRPQSQTDVKRDDFVHWVDKYLLPKARLNCNAIDLYAARCSIIHSYSAESRLSRDGLARQICYTSGSKDPKRLQDDVDSVNYDAVVIQIDTLFNAFRSSIDDFKKDLSSSQELAARVFGRSEAKFYFLLPPF
jgi:SPX domain protein involved in polyphosphate accumulation